MNQYEREKDQLDRDFAAGLISPAEYRKQLSELQRDYHRAAEEAAEKAYRDELDRW